MPSFRSPLLARDYKFFEAAKRAAEESDFKVHVGAVAVYQGRVIASAASLEKTHPMQKMYNSRFREFNQVGLSLPKMHAEIGLFAKLKKMEIPMHDVSVYVYRICKSREHGLARPCPACRAALKEIGIRKFYYTLDDGYAFEMIGEGA